MGEVICPNCGYRYLADESYDGVLCHKCRTPMQYIAHKCKNC